MYMRVIVSISRCVHMHDSVDYSDVLLRFHLTATIFSTNLKLDIFTVRLSGNFHDFCGVDRHLR